MTTTTSNETSSPARLQRGLQRGRHLRPHRQGLPCYTAGVRDIDAEELVLAVAFLAEALQLPDLNPKARTTGKPQPRQPNLQRAA